MANIAFIGDCHLGYRHRFKLQRLRDYSFAFEDATEKALKLQPDVVVFLGDLVHHSRPDPVSLRTVLKRLISIAKVCPVIVCVGNHEIEGHLGTTYSPIYGDVHDNIHVLTSEAPRKVLDIDGVTVGFHGFEYVRSREAAESRLREVAKGADSQLNILCMHQAIERYLSPYEISLSALRQVAPSFDLIVSGHVHKHQEITEVSDVTSAYYCGSTERISFNEAVNPTGFMFFKDNDWRNPRHVPVDSASMEYLRQEYHGAASDLNGLIERLIAKSQAKLLKIDIVAELSGDRMDVRRDWSGHEGARTILDINVVQDAKQSMLQLERIALSEELIKEYFEKTNNTDRQLQQLSIELFRKYGA
jgi:DNA repair exonuclease SbcCD nuclease subunit